MNMSDVKDILNETMRVRYSGQACSVFLSNLKLKAPKYNFIYKMGFAMQYSIIND